MAISYQIGDSIFSSTSMTFFTSSTLNSLADFGIRFAVGLAISAVVVSIIAYFAVRIIAHIYQRRKNNSI